MSYLMSVTIRVAAQSASGDSFIERGNEDVSQGYYDQRCDNSQA